MARARRLRLIAHRGFADAHPENTLVAVGHAVEVADAVEVDVRRCGSGELVVVHDETVDRISDGSGRVADLDLAVLQRLDVLGTGAGLPTLVELLDAVPPDVLTNVELKESGIAADALAAATDRDVLVSSFSSDALAEARAAAPGVPRAFLVREATEGALETAADLDCAAVHPHHSTCSRSFVSRAQSAGLAVNAWTVRDRATARALARVGVDGLIADHPAVVPSGRPL